MINFKSLLDLAIELNREKRNNVNPQAIAALPIYEYLREYGTIRLDIGRQTGKTSTVKAIADEDDLIIAGCIGNPTITKCHSTRVDLTKRYKRIFIEEPSFIDKEILREIYWRFSKDEFQTFILVGI